MAFHESGQRIVTGLIEHATLAFRNIGRSHPAEVLASLWANPAKFTGHVRKRLRVGEISDADDYARRTFAVLAAAHRLTVVKPADPAMRVTGKVHVVAEGWVVLLSSAGRIVTAYPFDPAMTSFEDRHRSMGDTLHEHDITEADRTLLAQLFRLR